jgi:putative transposase
LFSRSAASGCHIQPGKPTQNSFIESSNGRFRDECLNANWFENLADARRKVEAWREDYNQRRPHKQFGVPNTGRVCPRVVPFARNG